MGYSPKELSCNKIKETMSERQWDYLKPGVIKKFVDNYNLTKNDMISLIPSSSPMDEQKPETSETMTNNDDKSSLIDMDETGQEYTQAPSDDIYSTDYHTQIETDEALQFPSPMEQQYPSEVATINQTGQEHVDSFTNDPFNVSPAPQQDPSTVTTNVPTFVKNESMIPTSPPTDYHQHGVHPAAALPTEYHPDYVTSGYPPYPQPPQPYSCTYPAAAAYTPVMDPKYPMSMYGMYGMYGSYPMSYPQTMPPMKMDKFAEEWKEWQEWKAWKSLGSKVFGDDGMGLSEKKDCKKEMGNMREYYEEKVKKATKNEEYWKKKYEDLLNKCTQEKQTNFEGMSLNSNSNSNNSNYNKSPMSSSQFSVGHFSDSSMMTRKKKRRLDEWQDVNNYKQHERKRLRMDESSSCSDNAIMPSINNESPQHFDDWSDTQNEFASFKFIPQDDNLF